MGKYHLKRAKNDEFHWTLHADNGQVILQSETYVSKQGAESRVDWVYTADL